PLRAVARVDGRDRAIPRGDVDDASDDDRRGADRRGRDVPAHRARIEGIETAAIRGDKDRWAGGGRRSDRRHTGARRVGGTSGQQRYPDQQETPRPPCTCVMRRRKADIMRMCTVLSLDGIIIEIPPGRSQRAWRGDESGWPATRAHGG